MDISVLLADAVERRCSDIYIIAGRPMTLKAYGNMFPAFDERLDHAGAESFVRSVYSVAGGRDIERLSLTGDDDFSFSVPGLSRFRVNAYKQRGSYAAVIRVVRFDLPDPAALGIPDSVLALSGRKRGLVLVTGPAGSGKSTTLACIVDRINSDRSGHIVTLEDPIEYIHTHKKSIVSQREVANDTESYVKALRSALRQSPDVILLGEMRDSDTIAVAMTAAETGHLVLSSVHTIGAANTVDRIIDAFPPNQQHQTRIQLSMVLQAVVSQQLVPSSSDSVVPAFEIMMANSAVRNMIREAKTHQLDTAIQSSPDEGMVSMDASLYGLYRSRAISEQNALACALNPDTLEKRINATPF